jgi:hypothetical protein
MTTQPEKFHKHDFSFFFVIRAQSIWPGCTAALRLIVHPVNPPYVLDIPTFAARCLHILHNARDPSCERWNLWVRKLTGNFA